MGKIICSCFLKKFKRKLKIFSRPIFLFIYFDGYLSLRGSWRPQQSRQHRNYFYANFTFRLLRLRLAMTMGHGAMPNGSQYDDKSETEISRFTSNLTTLFEVALRNFEIKIKRNFTRIRRLTNPRNNKSHLNDWGGPFGERSCFVFFSLIFIRNRDSWNFLIFFGPVVLRDWIKLKKFLVIRWRNSGTKKTIIP